MKVSQKLGALPSSLFVEGVSCAEMNRPEGMGGYADVFRGSLEGCDVALKRLRIANYLVRKEEWKKVRHQLVVAIMYAHDDIFFVKPFYREALLWHQLRHTSILEFIGLDRSTFDGCICMVSPWMSNGDIARYLATHDEKEVHAYKSKWVRHAGSFASRCLVYAGTHNPQMTRSFKS